MTKRWYCRLLVGCALGCLCGCGEEPQPEPVAETVQQPPYSRLKDPDYLKEIQQRKTEKRRLMVAGSQAAQELEAAKAADPSGTSAHCRAAQARVEAAQKALEEFQRQARLRVQQGIQKEVNSVNVQQKGN